MINFMIKTFFSMILFFASFQSFAETLVLSQKNTVSLNDSVSDKSMSDLMLLLAKLDENLPDGEPIYLVINTPGGSVSSGLELVEFIKGLGRPVHTVTLFSASMGFQFVQAFADRYITESGMLMAHRATGQFVGQFPGEVNSRLNVSLQRINRLDSKVAKRVKMSVKDYQALVANEYWCEGEECIKDGFADKMVTVSCDKSLTGYTARTEKHIMQGRSLVTKYYFSNCPLRTGVVDFEIFIDGESFFPKDLKNKTLSSSSLKLTPQEIMQIESFIDKRKKAFSRLKNIK